MSSWAVAADADSLMREGIELRRKGDNTAALERFRKAHEIDGAARSLAQVGLAEQSLGAWSDAFRHVHDALAAGQDDWIQRNKRVLEEALAVIDGHLGMLDVTGEPTGAEVRVDGQTAGQLPLAQPLRLGVGTVVVEVSSEGYVKISRPVQIEHGVSASERFVLQRAATALIPVTEPPPGDMPGPTSTPSQRPADDHERPFDRRFVLAGGLAAGGVLSLGWGIIEDVVWQRRVSSFNSRADCWSNPSQSWSASCADLHDQGQRAKYLTFAGYGIGAALVATAAVVVVTRPTHSNSTALSCSPGMGTLGARCILRF
jgi:hypothetical protein